MTTIPLLGPLPLARTVAWHGGRPISAGSLQADAQALAARLPEGQPVNLCQDRYAFAVGLMAALLRGQACLMPPNALPDTLERLRRPDRDTCALVDREGCDAGTLPRLVVAHDPTLAPALQQPSIDADAEALFLMTSGSTGDPQPHAKRWGPLQVNIAGEAERIAALMGWPSLQGLALVATVPPQHSYGLESSVLLALLGGAAFDTGRPFFPADIADALARLPRPRALVTTPFHLKTLLQAGVPLPPTDLVLSATAPLSPQLAAAAEAALQGALIEIYGCTEAGQVAARRTTAGDRWTTLGALRLQPIAGDADGRCTVHGGHVLEPTVLADVLELDDAQHFRLLGRANDLIHVAGKRSSLAHLNYHLNRIPGVDDGAFWLPGADGEQVARLVAFVVAPTLGAAQVIDALRPLVEAPFLPRRVVHVDALPREATGKLTTRALETFARGRLEPRT
jgi:acyl-coenzyme A synthetase/AMP-(fatty) acid ligase